MAVPAAPAPSAPVRPSGWWYLATLGIAGVGLVVAIGLFANGVRSSRQVASEITSVEPGQSGLVSFEGAGDFTLYYAGPLKVVTAADMRVLEQEVGADLRPEAGGEPVPMQPYENETFGIGGNGQEQVVALSTFSIPAAGTYRLRTNEIEGISSTESRIIVGKSLYAPLARGAILALATIGLTAVLSAIASIALAVTRGRAKRARADPDPWGGGPWGQAPAWPDAPPQWTGPPPIIPPRPPGYGSGPGEAGR
jgi:hypothetical protein